jgi:hypothetical protein
MPRQTVSGGGELEPERLCSDSYDVRVKVEWDEMVTLTPRLKRHVTAYR